MKLNRAVVGPILDPSICIVCWVY